MGSGGMKRSSPKGANSAARDVRSGRDANSRSGDSSLPNMDSTVASARNVDSGSFAANRLTRVHEPEAAGTSITAAIPGSGSDCLIPASATPRGMSSNRAASSVTATFSGCSRYRMSWKTSASTESGLARCTEPPDHRARRPCMSRTRGSAVINVPPGRTAKARAMSCSVPPWTSV